MKLLNRFNVSRESNGPRKFSIEMTMSGVVSLAVVVLLGMCWIFILGILLGRGYRPENAVPKLAEMMPTTEASSSKAPDAAPAAEPKVLKPEDLTFMENDQSKDAEVVADSTQKPQDTARKPDDQGLKSHDLPDARGAAPAAVPPRPTPAPRQAVKAATPSRPAVAEAPKAKPKPEPKESAPKRSTDRYRAVYQVASFPSKEQANVMVKRLDAKGIKATVREAKSKDRTVFRVNIHLKGTESDLASGLKKTGEKGPILLEKKPL